MLKTRHYLKSAFANLKRNKWYTALMVLSLSAGMFCFVVASIYLNFEFNRNSNHKFSDSVYRIMLRVKDSNRNTYLPVKFSTVLANLHPEIESVNLLDRGNDVYVSANSEDYILEESVYYSDSQFFDVFTFPLKYGNEETALDGVKKVVISDKLSTLLFKDSNPIGEELIIHDKGTFLVSGVMDKVPTNSLLYPGIVFTRAQFFIDEPEVSEVWTTFTHIKVPVGMDQEEMEATLYKSYQGLTTDDRVDGVFSEKLSDAYWGTSFYDYSGGLQYSSITGANKQMIKTIGYVSFGVLVCAFIGYLSLSLGLSLKRAKEIGVRKVNGAERRDIKIQLLSESIFYALLSLLITTIALELTSSYFSNLFQVPMDVGFSQPLVLILLIGFSILTGALAGVYPAFVVSKINPIKVLSGYNSPLGSGFRLKQYLLVGQFVVTIILVFGVYVQRQQVRKMLSFDFGYNKQRVLTFSTHNNNIRQNFSAVLEEIKQINGIESISGGPFPFTINGYSEFMLDKGDTLLKDEVGRVIVDNNFFEIMEIPIVSGQSFMGMTSEIALSQACIINESMATLLGDSPLGLTITYANEPRTIIGIAKNYTDWGLSQPEADPRIFLPTDKANYHSVLLKYEGTKSADIIPQLEAIWRNYERVIVPDVRDLEAKKDYSTADLIQITTLFSFLAGVVLLLSFLNLLGVSLIFASSKIRNISIRRILGAQTIELFFRLSKPFVIALSISLFVALPISYWLMKSYLNNFAVRINLDLSQGIVISCGMLLALFMVIGYQTLRFSKVDPVDILKNE